MAKSKSNRLLMLADKIEKNRIQENSSKRTAKLTSLQVGRGIAAFFVVLFHTTAIFELNKYWGSRPFGFIFIPGNSGVYFFFVLSGFIIAYAHSKDFSNPNRLLHYIKNRIIRIYPMYWIAAFSSLLASIFIYKLHFHFKFIVGNFTLLPLEGDSGNLAVAWSLFHEVIFYIIFSTLIVHLNVGRTILFSWALGCILNVFVTIDNAFLEVVFSPINLLFFIGLIAYFAGKNRRPEEVRLM